MPGFSLKEGLAQTKNAIVSALIGVGIGILPGIGGGVSCMISYTVSKNTSKHRELYGTGIMDGVVASETANNATIGGAMIPCWRWASLVTPLPPCCWEACRSTTWPPVP